MGLYDALERVVKLVLERAAELRVLTVRMRGSCLAIFLGRGEAERRFRYLGPTLCAGFMSTYASPDTKSGTSAPTYGNDLHENFIALELVAARRHHLLTRTDLLFASVCTLIGLNLVADVCFGGDRLGAAVPSSGMFESHAPGVDGLAADVVVVLAVPPGVEVVVVCTTPPTGVDGGARVPGPVISLEGDRGTEREARGRGWPRSMEPPDAGIFLDGDRGTELVRLA